MKLFKILTFFLIVLLIIFTFFYFTSKKTTFAPISQQNDFYKNLDLAINTANLTTSSYQIRDFNNDLEFYLLVGDNQTKVIISTLKDPFWQISTLQQVVKTAKINQEEFKLIDLSSKHPYVTFKNN